MANNRRSAQGNSDADLTSPFKIHLTPDELKVLDESSYSDPVHSSRTRSRRLSISSSVHEKPDPNYQRFFATLLVLVTAGVIGFLINIQLYNDKQHSLASAILFISVLPFTWLTHEWHRLHGAKLTRELRPMLNIASLLETYKNVDPLYANIYVDNKDRIFSCCDGPELNSDLPRTSDENSEREKSPKPPAKKTKQQP